MADLVDELEKRYVALNQKLCHKINSLLWLDSVEKLQREPKSEIERRFEDIAKNASAPQAGPGDANETNPNPTTAHMDPSRLVAVLRSSLSLQTDTYLNDVLQVTLPILRSTHVAPSQPTGLEQQLAANLQLLYSSESEDAASVYSMARMFQQAETNDGNMILARHHLVSYLINTVKPRVLEYDAASKRHQERAADALAQKNHQIDEFVRLLSFDEVEAIDIMYSDLVKLWLKLAIYCDLLPGIVVNLPLNWHEDPNLDTIISDCEDIGAAVTQNQALVNVDTIRYITSERLISIVDSLQ